jgi:pimeloyl-ACP methyl ester carboxylesterase
MSRRRAWRSAALIQQRRFVLRERAKTQGAGVLFPRGVFRKPVEASRLAHGGVLGMLLGVFLDCRAYAARARDRGLESCTRSVQRVREVGRRRQTMRWEERAKRHFGTDRFPSKWKAGMPLGISAVVSSATLRHCVTHLTEIDRRSAMQYQPRLSTASPTRWSRAGMEWRTIRVDNRAEIIGVLGRGSPLVFLHGWGLTPRIYRHALARLARNFRVYAPVIPGFVGVPDRPPDERTLGDYSTWLRQILGAAGIGPVTLVGHSLGGAIAIRAAHDLPDRVSRLVLVNSVGGGSCSGGCGEVRPIRERPLWEWGAAALSLDAPIRMNPWVGRNGEMPCRSGRIELLTETIRPRRRASRRCNYLTPDPSRRRGSTTRISCRPRD